MDPLWLTIAFGCGYLLRQVGLPPMVGFLIAGFVLNGLGIQGGDLLQTMADLGVTLLLFSIGLKLDLRSLLRAEIWAGSSLHLLLSMLLTGLFILACGALGVGLFAGLDFQVALLVAFALSFSSTVFAVKVLEQKGEMAAMHGRVAIGILIMQDVFAVLFLTISAGKVPSPWALAIPLLLWLLRPLLYRLLNRCGHGELLVLCGFFLALVAGYSGFVLVGLKGDLGALIMGVLLSGHPRASELSKSLLGFKDLLLVGFFLSIGLSGVPDGATLVTALLLVFLLPFKTGLYFLLLTRFRLRARSALLASFSLANYSEFGLIVGAIAVSSGWLDSQWLVAVAIALSLSFVLAAPLNSAAATLYARWQDTLKRFETRTRHPSDQPLEPGEVSIAVFGMGRIGTAVYDYFHKRYADKVVGVDYNKEKVARHCREGRHVIYGDPTDPDFWARTPHDNRIKLCLLAMPKHVANLSVAATIRGRGYRGRLASIAHFADQIDELENLGVVTFDLYAEAGSGFARHAGRLLAQDSGDF
ncbi:potassium transporter Kef [Geothermobacter hydrogeniphilus]|uniref:Potassium transporter Kef n=1 Tax=Geothermobacter hydrogeniphilus TaxID=1969733 RepID=A0A2K2H8D5_9BACT|nr:cation:proton antiporter family protein [Geothermobacter hydrogeniphilus]PNU19582.1 potassium transporter Kef [Geothermobacter hydrogeniphilus]